LGEHPYLGWSSWSLEATKQKGYGAGWLNSAHVRQQSDAMASRLQSHGYTYLNVDAGWRGGWDEFGRPTPDKEKFPEGMKALADYAHGKGQKFGIYYIPGIDDDLLAANPPIEGTNRHLSEIILYPRRPAHGWRGGNAIDFSKPGAQEYIDSIAKLFASWGVDFLKFDGVAPGSDQYRLDIDARANVAAWGRALIRTGRPIWLTISWKVDRRYNGFWRKYANALRIAGDVESYDETLTHWPQIARRFEVERLFASTAGQGRGWNDLDSLIVGNGRMSGLTEDERRSAMTFWAISCSPIYCGDDLTKLDDFGLSLLTNDEVLAVQQAGNVGSYLGDLGVKGAEVWISYADNGDAVVAVFNLSDQPISGKISWPDVGLHDDMLKVRDLWKKRETGTTATDLELKLPPHACKLLRIAK
jgi:hypothetical protein